MIWREVRLAAPPFIINDLLIQNIEQLSESQRIRIELIRNSSHHSLSKREIDIAISIDDKLSQKFLKIEQIESEIIGDVAYAVYAHKDVEHKNLPWAGVREGHIKTSGSEAMLKLAGKEGFRFRSYSFDSLRLIAAKGVAKVMLPRIVADDDPNLTAISDTVLEQPLRMLFHHQDQDVHHLKDTRDWIKSLV